MSSRQLWGQQWWVVLSEPRTSVGIRRIRNWALLQEASTLENIPYIFVKGRKGEGKGGRKDGRKKGKQGRRKGDE